MVMDSPWRLDVGGLTEVNVIIAMVLVACGAAVLPATAWAEGRPHTSSAVVHFQPACASASYTLAMSTAFKAKYTGCWDVGALIHGWARSKWKCICKDAPEATDVRIATLEDMRKFLQQVRRVQRPHRGLSGRYFPARAAP